MMLRMFWKEWRESRLALLAVLLAACVPVLLGSGMTFSGDLGSFSPWALAPVILAIKLGIRSYESEGARGRGDFLYSRPINWRALLAAKLMPGIVSILLASSAAAVCYLIFAASPYKPFITGERMGQGIGLLAIAIAMGYFSGYAASALKLERNASAIVYGFMYICVMLHTQISAAVGRGMRSDVFQTNGFGVAGWFVGGVIAAGVITRFGLTAGFGWRLRIYIICIAAALAVMVPAEAVWKNSARHRSVAVATGVNPDICSDIFLSVSPNGKYGITSGSMVRLNGSRLTRTGKLPERLPWFAYSAVRAMVRWVEPDGRQIAYWADDTSPAVTMADPAGGKARRVSLPANVTFSWPSPGGRHLLVSTGPTSRDHTLYAVDLVNGRLIHTGVEGATNPWWHSDSQIGYQDKSGRRFVMPLPL